jgi:hypothetical protein
MILVLQELKLNVSFRNQQPDTLIFAGQKPTGNWQLATGNWQLATDNWQLATGLLATNY